MERKAPAYQHVPAEEVELRDSLSSGISYPSPTKRRSNSNRFRNLDKRLPSRLKVKSVWSRCKPVLIAVCIHGLPLAVVAFIIFGIVLSTTKTFGSIGSVCSINGQYLFTGIGIDSGEIVYNPWNRSETFSINLAFGQLPFGKAKLIDVVWDVGVGRGGQTVLAVISYRVLNQALARSMEVGSVSRATFEAVALEQGSIFGLVKIVRDFYKNEGARAKAVISWMIISTITVLVFPTLASAMTGYSVNFEAYVSDTNQSLLLLSDFRPVFYIIHDGSRLGSDFHDDFLVVDSSAPPFKTSHYYCDSSDSGSAERAACRAQWKSPCSASAPGTFRKGQITIDWNQVQPTCDLLWQISAYTYRHGFNSKQNTTSYLYDRMTDTNITLEGPTLNISDHFYFQDRTGEPVRCDADELSWAILPCGSDLPGPELYSNNQSSHLFDRLAISKGTCQQPQLRGSGPVTYSWGFSLQLLLYCLVMLLVWTIGTYTIYMDTYLNGNQAILKRNMGMHRAILDLAIEYQKELGSVDDVSMYSNKALLDAVDGCSISYTVLVAQNSQAISRLKQYERCHEGKVWWRQKRYTISSLILVVSLTVIISVMMTEFTVP